MLDLRAKNSAPSIDPKCSAHEQVRALSPLPSSAVEDPPLFNQTPKPPHNTKQKTKRPYLAKQSREDSESSDNYAEQFSSNQDGLEDELSIHIESQGQRQSIIELMPYEIGSPDLDVSSIYSDNNQPRLPSPPWSQNVHPLGNGDLISMAAANLGEMEYEELQRIYRERVW